jgi:hypothetical protein
MFVSAKVKSSISLNGGRWKCVNVGIILPVIFIAESRTPRCHKQLGVHPGYVSEKWHNPTAWCDKQSMTAYDICHQTKRGAMQALNARFRYEQYRPPPPRGSPIIGMSDAPTASPELRGHVNLDEKELTQRCNHFESSRASVNACNRIREKVINRGGAR